MVSSPPINRMNVVIPCSKGGGEEGIGRVVEDDEIGAICAVDLLIGIFPRFGRETDRVVGWTVFDGAGAVDLVFGRLKGRKKAVLSVVMMRRSISRRVMLRSSGILTITT